MFLKVPKFHENPSSGPHAIYTNAPKITGHYDVLLDTHEKKLLAKYLVKDSCNTTLTKRHKNNCLKL